MQKLPRNMKSCEEMNLVPRFAHAANNYKKFLVPKFAGKLGMPDNGKIFSKTAWKIWDGPCKNLLKIGRFISCIQFEVEF